ncbi:YdcF family protein [Roseovarius salis]|uniref:YdcF family protein n=1 Tax=Roseovarius salis TaxID=3376063 RepID=UPI0037CC6897
MTEGDTDQTGRAVALVLGAAVRTGGQPSAALKRRALHAARLYRQGAVSVILASGGPPGAEPSEAEVIRCLCMTAGVADADILVEDRAATTRENIANALPILSAHALSPVWIVTDRYHARRALMTARACGLRARTSCPDPTGATPWRLARSHLREAVAIAVYKLCHWRGR